uniref:Putative B-type response regulator 13 n=1 Tax=Rhizophora mucronata TaxID=61149 RepID=A0A2P2LXZ7_RHIMU
MGHCPPSMDWTSKLLLPLVNSQLKVLPHCKQQELVDQHQSLECPFPFLIKGTFSALKIQN